MADTWHFSKRPTPCTLYTVSSCTYIGGTVQTADAGPPPLVLRHQDTCPGPEASILHVVFRFEVSDRKVSSVFGCVKAKHGTRLSAQVIGLLVLRG
eukprot:scaffold89135_cov17-Tisochrysis_lutea.AAC.1